MAGVVIGNRLRKLEPGSLVTLYQAVTTGLGAPNDLFFYNHDPTLGSDVVTFQNNAYTPYPLTSDGYEASSRGVLPRPTIALSNVGGFITELCNSYGDLVGCKIIRRRTLAEFLDGKPGADPTQELTPEVFYVNRKVAETNTQVSFELASRLDIEGVFLPRDQMLANACSFLYRGDDCAYAGSAVADKLDNPLGAHFPNGVANGTATFTSATANFTAADVLRMVVSDGAQIPADTNIISVNSTTSVQLNRSVTTASAIPFTLAGRVVGRGLYNSGTTYAAGDQTYTAITGSTLKLFWVSLVNGNTSPLTDLTKWALDRCAKKLHSCKMRFGATGVLRTHALPGIDRLA